MSKTRIYPKINKFEIAIVKSNGVLKNFQWWGGELCLEKYEGRS